MEGHRDGHAILVHRHKLILVADHIFLPSQDMRPHKGGVHVGEGRRHDHVDVLALDLRL
jgi:hypothetical protein